MFDDSLLVAVYDKVNASDHKLGNYQQIAIIKL